MRKKDLKHVAFYPVPKSSHLLIKSYVSKTGGMEYYENLLQVTIRNFSIIYDLGGVGEPFKK